VRQSRTGRAGVSARLQAGHDAGGQVRGVCARGGHLYARLQHHAGAPVTCRDQGGGHLQAPPWPARDAASPLVAASASSATVMPMPACESCMHDGQTMRGAVMCASDCMACKHTAPEGCAACWASAHAASASLLCKSSAPTTAALLQPSSSCTLTERCSLRQCPPCCLRSGQEVQHRCAGAAGGVGGCRAGEGNDGVPGARCLIPDIERNPGNVVLADASASAPPGGGS